MSKAKTLNKKVIQDSEQDSSSELPLIVNKKQQIKAKKQTKKKAVVQQSSEQQDTPVVKAKVSQKARKASNASMDEQSEKVQKKPTKVVKTETAPVRKVSVDKKKKKQESSSQESQEQAPKKVVKSKSPLQKPVVNKKKAVSSSEQSQEQQKPKVTKKPVVPVKTATKPAAKKTQSSSEQSQEEAPKKIPAKSPLQKVKSPVVKAVTKKPAKQESSSDQSQEQVKPAKKAVVAKSPLQKVAKKPVKKQSSDEQEQQKPQQKAPLRKASNDLKVNKKQQQQEQQLGQFQACVQGLSFNAYDNDIRQLCEPCGQIININLLMRPDGKPKGIAFVKFNKKSSLNKCLQMNGQQHMGRSLKIQQARGKPTPSGQSMPGRGRSFGDNKPSFQSNATIETPTLFIGGLSYNSTAESIKQHFSTAGAVQSARVVTDRQTGKPRGFGYIEFYDVQTAKSAYQTMNGSYLDGRAIRLDSAAQRDRPQNGGGFGGQRGGFGGGQRGGFGGNSRNPGNSTVNLSQDDKNAKKGAIGTFQGKKVTF